MKITLEQFKKFANDNDILWFYNKPVWRTTPMDVDSKEFRKHNKEQLDKIRKNYKDGELDALPYIKPYWSRFAGSEELDSGKLILATSKKPLTVKILRELYHKCKEIEIPFFKNQKQKREKMKVNVEIAKICHEANRQYCIANQLRTHAKWDELPDTMQESVTAGVAKIIENPKITAEEMHEAWMEYKAEESWIYGDEIDVPGKEHPNMVAWKKLSKVERGKDKLFLATVKREMNS